MNNAHIMWCHSANNASSKENYELKQKYMSRYKKNNNNDNNFNRNNNNNRPQRGNSSKRNEEPKEDSTEQYLRCMYW